MSSPRAVLVISGKRKSGKDYISEILLERLQEKQCGIFRLSGPLKKQYAKEHNLDFEKLLDATEYKEMYRADMIKWGEERRKQDPSFFCRLATCEEGAQKDVWIISDARRLSDVDYFKQNHADSLITVRVECDVSIRQKRGFVFTEGVDDAESECGLDSGVTWDMLINNDGTQQALEGSIGQLIDQINRKLDGR